VPVLDTLRKLNHEEKLEVYKYKITIQYFSAVKSWKIIAQASAESNTSGAILL